MPPVGVQFFKNVSMQTHPGAIGVMAIHQLLPDWQWKLIRALIVPGNLFHLESSVGTIIEDRSAEQKQKGNVSFFQRVKILRCAHIQVVCAVNG